MNGSRDFNAGLISDEPFTIGKKVSIDPWKQIEKNWKTQKEFQGSCKVIQS